MLCLVNWQAVFETSLNSWSQWQGLLWQPNYCLYLSMCWFGLSWAPPLIAAAVAFSLESEILLRDTSVSGASTYTGKIIWCQSKMVHPRAIRIHGMASSILIGWLHEFSVSYAAFTHEWSYFQDGWIWTVWCWNYIILNEQLFSILYCFLICHLFLWWQSWSFSSYYSIRICCSLNISHNYQCWKLLFIWNINIL